MEMDVRALNALIPVFDFVGIVAFALSGVFEGIKRRIDPVGVFIVAFSTAFGGGMLMTGTSLRMPSVSEFSVSPELRFPSQPGCPGCLPSSSDVSPVCSAV